MTSSRVDLPHTRVDLPHTMYPCIAQFLTDDPKSICRMAVVSKSWRDGLNTAASFRVWKEAFSCCPSFEYESNVRREQQEKDPATLSELRAFQERAKTITRNIECGNFRYVRTLDCTHKSIHTVSATKEFIIVAGFEHPVDTITIINRSSGQQICKTSAEGIIQKLIVVSDEIFLTFSNGLLLTFWQHRNNKIEKIKVLTHEQGLPRYEHVLSVQKQGDYLFFTCKDEKGIYLVNLKDYRLKFFKFEIQNPFTIQNRCIFIVSRYVFSMHGSYYALLKINTDEMIESIDDVEKHVPVDNCGKLFPVTYFDNFVLPKSFMQVFGKKIRMVIQEKIGKIWHSHSLMLPSREFIPILPFSKADRWFFVVKPIQVCPMQLGKNFVLSPNRQTAKWANYLDDNCKCEYVGDGTLLIPNGSQIHELSFAP